MNFPSLNRNQSHRLCTLLMLAAGSCISHTAQATILSWLNASGGSAATPANWNPNQLPTSADDLQFSLNDSYTVVFPASLTTGRSILVNRGSVSANFANYTTTSQVSVAQTVGNSATFNITGNLTCQSFFTLAVNSGTTSNSMFNSAVGSSSLLKLTSANTDAIVGQAGTATLRIFNNSQFLITESADDFLIGNLATGIGNVILRSSITAPASLVINAASATSDLVVGVAGQGTLELGTNSVVNLSANCFVALSAGSTGTVILGETFTNVPPTMTIQRDLHVGHNMTGAAAGNGSLTIDSGGTVQVGTSASHIGTAFIGDPNGGPGTLTITEGLFSTENLIIDPTNGFLDHTGGTLQLRAGGTFSSPVILEINGPSSVNAPTVEIIDHTTTLNGGFFVGDNAFGVLDVHSGSTVTYTFNASSPTQAKMIGEGTASRGIVTISGSGTTFHESTTIPTSFIVGRRGEGQLTVTDGASFRTNSGMNLAVLSTSRGVFEIADDATAHIGQTLTIGGDTGTGGNANLTMSGDATLTVNSMTVHRTGSATLTGSNLGAINTISILNQMTAHSSRIIASLVDIVGSMNASGTIDAQVNIANTGTLDVNHGNLVVGLNASDQGFHSEGHVTVIGRTLTIRDSDFSPMGDLDLNNGTVNSTSTLDFSQGSLLRGHGTINAPTRFSDGVWRPAFFGGGTLTFNGPVDGLFIDSQSGQVHFGSLCVFTGSGTIRSAVSADPASHIIPLNQLELGNNDVNAAINLQGRLSIGAHRVNLYSNSPASLGTLTTIAGGILDGPDSNPRVINVFGNQITVFDSVPFELSAGDVIQGFGTILTQIQSSAGSRLTLTGALNMQGTSTSPDILGFGNSFVGWAGLLEVGPHALTINQVHRPSGEITIDGGYIYCPQIVNLGTLSGNGTIECHDSSFVNADTLTITGTGAQDMFFRGGFLNRSAALFGPGVINLRIGSEANNESDMITVQSGDVILGGTLNISTFGQPLDPDFNYHIFSVTSGNISGQFDEVNLPHGMTIIYEDSDIYITGICFADFNFDGGIDGSDITAFFEAWEAGDFTADVNRDGGVDGSDVDRFFEAWEAGAC